MRLPFFAALLGVLTTSLAHNIQLGAHQRECFHEVLHKDDKMTVTFQVGDREFGGAGNLEIDFWIVGPTNEYVANQKAVSSGDYSFDARDDGKHLYCFSNEAWSASTKEVSFNVHGIVYVPESEAPSDPLEAEVKQLTELLNQVKDEQSYIVVRERTHRNTAESTNGRVKWWSIFQLGVLIGEGIFQVWWLKRFFEEVHTPYSPQRYPVLLNELLIPSPPQVFDPSPSSLPLSSETAQTIPSTFSSNAHSTIPIVYTATFALNRALISFQYIRATKCLSYMEPFRATTSSIDVHEQVPFTGCEQG